MNILRDAATLQAQLRMFDTLEQTRLTILKLRMSLRQNWVALAVAYGLNNNWVACQKLLEEFLGLAKVRNSSHLKGTQLTVEQEIPSYDPEYSELLLFYIAALEYNEEYQKALDKLVQSVDSNQILDRMRTSIVHPRLLKKLGRTEDAKAYYKKLIARNPDCCESYQAYFESTGLSFGKVESYVTPVECIYFPTDSPSAEDAEKITSELEGFATEFPRALVPQRILLTVTKGEQFERLVKKYIHRALKKNLPSLFVDLKPLYKDQEKRQVIQSIVENYRTELEAAKGSDVDGEQLLVVIRQASESGW
jgi:peptide alpha-N-acetyltransferase